MMVLSVVWGCARKPRAARSHAFNAPHVPQLAAVPLAASAVVVVAVVVELDAEARTGSRRSMMTDDSRPSIYASDVELMMQRLIQVFLYGEIHTLPK